VFLCRTCDAANDGALEVTMLWTIFVILLVLWLLGVVSANTFGGFLHVLLALAVAVALLRAMQKRESTE
jgi:Family of unknown function (DUF5670)